MNKVSNFKINLYEVLGNGLKQSFGYCNLEECCNRSIKETNL